MAFPIFQNLAGTLKSAFRIGAQGPSLRQGSVDPNSASVQGSDGDIFILNSELPSLFQRRDGFWHNVAGEGFKRTAVTTNEYNVLLTDYYIGVNFNGDVDIFLPAGVENKVFIIKDESGLVNNSTRRINIIPDGLETIDGETEITVQAAYTSLTIVYGTEWHLI
jgi:hypothetical protein